MFNVFSHAKIVLGRLSWFFSPLALVLLSLACLVTSIPFLARTLADVLCAILPVLLLSCPSSHRPWQTHSFHSYPSFSYCLPSTQNEQTDSAGCCFDSACECYSFAVLISNFVHHRDKSFAQNQTEQLFCRTVRTDPGKRTIATMSGMIYMSFSIYCPLVNPKYPKRSNSPTVRSP